MGQVSVCNQASLSTYEFSDQIPSFMLFFLVSGMKVGKARRIRRGTAGQKAVKA